MVDMDATRWIGERAVTPEEQGQRQDGESGRGQGSYPPAGGGGNSGHEHRRQCPAEVAGEAMNRKGVAEPGRRHVAVENGEIGRMENAVAQPGEDAATTARPVYPSATESRSAATRKQPMPPPTTLAAP